MGYADLTGKRGREFAASASHKPERSAGTLALGRFAQCHVRQQWSAELPCKQQVNERRLTEISPAKADCQQRPTKLPKKEVLKGLNSYRSKWSFLAQENGMFQASLICHWMT
jgi:hypothetical protein